MEAAMRVDRRHWLRWAAIALLMAAAGLPPAARADAPTEDLAIETRDGTVRFRVEIAATEEDRQRGLMHRTALAPEAGMLFVWAQPVGISMWMKNTEIPLDMLFLSTRGIVTRIAENTEPHSLTPIPSGGPILGVLEVNAGTVKRHGIRIGDRVRHPVFAPSGQ